MLICQKQVKNNVENTKVMKTFSPLFCISLFFILTTLVFIQDYASLYYLYILLGVSGFFVSYNFVDIFPIVDMRYLNIHNYAIKNSEKPIIVWWTRDIDERDPKRRTVSVEYPRSFDQHIEPSDLEEWIE
jgi:hypothetical protein